MSQVPVVQSGMTELENRSHRKCVSHSAWDKFWWFNFRYFHQAWRPWHLSKDCLHLPSTSSASDLAFHPPCKDHCSD
eukprot:s305_g19.t1